MNYYTKVLKNYAVFSGRARRKEYWMFALCNVLIGIALGLFEGILGVNSESNQSTFASIYQLIVLIPSLAVGVRRMHDVDKSGWNLIIPIYNLILTLREGTKGDNKYGPDPKSENGKAKYTSDSIEKPITTFCYKCGMALELDSTYCSKCGAKVVSPPIE